MIVSEKMSGTLYRIYPDPDKPEFDASWFLTNEGEIKALLFKDLDRKMFNEFREWIESINVTIKCESAIPSVEKILKRFGFKEFVRENG